MTVPQLRSQVLLRSEESRGSVSVVENVVAPRAKGPCLHRHDFDEAFYMLEGELVFQIDDQLVTKRKGDLAFAPRNVSHALTNRTDEPARYVLVCTPAGLERSFARMAAEQVGEDPPEWALQPIPEVTPTGPQIDG
jgi:quercetin dioxygenase-like cupin family protein